MSQELAEIKSEVLIRKKSILDLFVSAGLRGIKEKSFLPGQKSRYGSVRLRSIHNSRSNIECLELGTSCMLRQSMLVPIGSVEKVQFQSPPIIVGRLPRLLTAALSLAKKPGL